MSRKTKYVGWLRNQTDSRDDEPLVVWARSIEEAEKLVHEKMDTHRFFVRGVYSIKDFRRFYGNYPL
jgi:hypothetical protein